MSRQRQLLFQLPALVLCAAGAGAAPQDPPRILAWNDLGMHCIDPDFSIFSILPPFNNVNAQLILNGVLQGAGSGVTFTYEAVADASGSINTSSIGKTNFWDHEDDLFGVDLPPDVGLTGNAMPGAGNIPQAMTYDGVWEWFQATGVPITPFDDGMDKNRYPLMKITARNASGAVIASTVTVLPNSDEMDCSMCHASGQSPYARPDDGWFYDADPLRDERLNILALHDDRQLGDPVFDTALVDAGYDSAGLVATALGGTSVLCARCHPSNALGTGMDGISHLTHAVHSLHGNVVDPTGATLDELPERSSCYTCHPGLDTKCLRGAMGRAIGPDGDFSMQCQSCHESMNAVGDSQRVGWLDQPACQNCHTGTATDNTGEIRYTNAFDDNGDLRQPASTIFATTPDVPAQGFSLYRFSTGHGDLQCSACHGPPHAIYPTHDVNDNQQSINLQGHIGTITDCTVCHGQLEDDEFLGPHGMHPVTQKWVNDVHKDAAQQQGLAYCRSCHGADDRGTVLSRAQGDRTFNAFGQKNFWRGFQVGCYTCHNGPSNDHATNNHAPVVPTLSDATPNDVPVQFDLTGTDSDGDALTYRIVSQPDFGTVALAGHMATYLPEAGHVGPVSFTFAASDGRLDSNLGVASVDVQQPSCGGTTREYGFGSPGTGGFLPTLSVWGCPKAGGVITVTIDQALGGSQALLIVGDHEGNQELWPGTVLRVAPVRRRSAPLPLSSGGPGEGSFSLSFGLPPNYSGKTMAFQAFVFDGSGSHGFATSNGVEIEIQ